MNNTGVEVMTTYRRTKRQQFLIIDQATASDLSISLEARGLLVYLLSLPDDWVVNHTHLRKATGCGRDRLYRIIGDLEEAGYVRKTAVRGKKGQFKEWQYDIYERPMGGPQAIDSPLPENPEVAPLPENPEVAISPFPDLPDPAIRTLPITKRDIPSTNKPKNHTSSDDDGQFDVFWDAYPKKVDKKAARKAWDKLKPDNDLIDKMVTHIGQRRLHGDWKGIEAKFIPSPTKWLNGERWDDEITIYEENINETHQRRDGFNRLAGSMRATAEIDLNS